MLKTIVIINDCAYVSGGAGKVAFMSAKALASLGYRVIAFTAAGPIDQFLIDASVEVICLGQKDILQEKNKLKAMMQGIWNNLAYTRFKELLQTLDPTTTVLHFHGWSKSLSSSVLSAASEFSFPVVVTMHDYFLHCPNLGLYNYRTQQICHKTPSSFCCYVSNCDSRNYVIKLWRSVRGMVQKCILRKFRKRIDFIYIGETNKKVSMPSLDRYAHSWNFVQNPIDLNLHNPVEITKNDKYLFVARLSAEKGIEMFCEALTQLELKGIVLGDGPLRANIEKKYPNIEFAGWVTGKEMDAKIRECKALLFPSLWYEGAPLTIPEMLSYGIPCIVPDQCAASELIEDGKNGFIFKSGNLESLKEVVLKFENTDILSIQNYIKKTFDCKKYSLERHIEILLKVYNDSINTIRQYEKETH